MKRLEKKRHCDFDLFLMSSPEIEVALIEIKIGHSGRLRPHFNNVLDSHSKNHQNTFFQPLLLGHIRIQQCDQSSHSNWLSFVWLQLRNDREETN